MISLKFAANRYDKIEPLINNEVQIRDVELQYTQLPIAEIFYRQLKNAEFDISDMSISFYLIAKSLGKLPYVAIPVFPMREFFHSRIVVSKHSGITRPEDLKEKRFGLPEYAVTASLWTRAVLQHEFGIPLDGMEWFVERPLTDSLAFAAGWKNPTGMKISEIPRDKSLLSMLDSGELDAAFIYRQEIKSRMERSTEDMFGPGHHVKKLFPDQKSETIRYYQKTGYYPINHLMVIRESIAEKYPELPMQIFSALEESKQIAQQRNRRLAFANNSFVWLDSLQEEIDSVLGQDPFPYGIQKNSKILSALLQYSLEQGLTTRKLTFEEMFHKSTLST